MTFGEVDWNESGGGNSRSVSGLESGLNSRPRNAPMFKSLPAVPGSNTQGSYPGAPGIAVNVEVRPLNVCMGNCPER